MGNRKSVLQHILDRSDLMDEAMPGKPLIELIGDGRLLIENHYGITEYSLTRICVRVSYGGVIVAGCNLRLRQMSSRKLLICGRIDGVELLRGQFG